MAVIGVLGSYGGLNLGDEAILTAILASLRRNRPGDELVVFSRDAEHTRAHHDADRVVAARDVSRDQILPEIARLDLLLGGGGLLYDGEARAYLRDVRLAQERGIPTFAYAVGAGPLEAPEDRQQVLESLERMAGITVRDELSQRVLEDVGVERPIEVTADPALLLEPEPFTDEMLAREGVEHARHMVGVSVREPGKAAPDLDEAGYHQLLAHAADFIVHRYDADLMFVPMERDDIRHSHAVVGHMLAADRAHILKGSYTPRQILGLMAHVDAVLGMRLHVLIFAAVAGVPFLPLPYAGKVSDFVAALGLHVPGPASRESTGPLLAAFDRMWDARGAEGQRLRNRVPSLQERARRTLPAGRGCARAGPIASRGMPPITRPETPASVLLPPRRARLAADTDVLVVGGGPAGIGAALGAAEAGAEVILAERYGFLGGNATVALVMPWMSFHTRRPQPPRLADLSLLPGDHGEGEPVVAGKHVEMIERLVAAGGAVAPSLDTGYTVPFDPEVFKTVALDLLDEAGVRELFHAFASGVLDVEGGQGVIFETKSGPVVVRAQVVVDATGDGDVAAAAGARYELGRPEDGLVQPMTLMFRMVGFDREAFGAYIRDHPDQWRGVHGLWDLVAAAAAAGDLDLPRDDILFFGTPHPEEVAVNSTRVTGALGIDVWDLTRAEAVSRRQARQVADFLRRYVPGFADAYVAQTGVGIGVRETRRIVGEYQLTGEDVLSARKFDDVIARGTYPVDIHEPVGKGTLLRPVPAGDAYDIPLRCLLPRGVERVLVAGRCISGTHVAHSSYRVTPTAMATGQAAGVCAALAARGGRTPREVPVADVQRALVAQGADLRRPLLDTG